MQDIPWQDRPLVKRRHRKTVTERLVPPKGETFMAGPALSQLLSLRQGSTLRLWFGVEQSVQIINRECLCGAPRRTSPHSALATSKLTRLTEADPGRVAPQQT